MTPVHRLDRGPRRLPVIFVAVAIVLVIVVAVLVVRTMVAPMDSGTSLANGARVSASSTAVGYSPVSAVVEQTTMPTAGWRSDSQTVGAWLALAWPERHEVHSVSIQVPSRSQPGVTAGVLSFGDGSSVQVVLSGKLRATVVPITPRSVRSIRFTATGFAVGAVATTIERFTVDPSGDSAAHDPSGDAVRSATAAASSGHSPSIATGAGWKVPAPTGATLRFAWDEPRELVGIVLTGARGSISTVKSGTLRFGSGGSVAIGAVPGDPGLPTTVAFMPHVTLSATLTIDEVDGSGDLNLSSIRLLEHGTDVAPVAALPSSASATTPEAGSCDGVPTPVAVTVLSVICPQDGARVGDTVELLVDLPIGAVGVSADVWPASGPAMVPTARALGTGSVRLALSLRGLPFGPVTVSLTATGGLDQVVRFQLLHGAAADGASATSAAADGKTLVYDDEFDGPLSAERSGNGTRYAAGKSETNDVADFGDAIFADPADGLDNLGVLDDQYLRISVLPKPDGYADPQGWNRKSIGGSISSARPGGSGFSAQYGYFETRMLVPAMPGTWPAFWLMPSTNLTSTQKAVAEFDAVELYGHDPLGACESTHQYVDGVQNGGFADCARRFTSERAAAQWHTYGVDVTPTQVIFYIDGRRVATAPQVRGGGDPMFFMADLALGGGWPIQLDGTKGRAQLLVDWIRVYV